MNKMISSIITAVIITAAINAFLNHSDNSFAQPQTGRCGDRICDEFEKGRRHLCPQDCPPGESAELQVDVNVAAIPAAPNEAKIRAEVLNVMHTTYANNKVSKLSLKIIDYKNIEGVRPNPGEIEAAAYHKNNDSPLLLGIKSGDEIEAVLSLSGDEHGSQWQIREVKISQKEGKSQALLPVTASVTVDYSQGLGTFSPYLFGIQGLKLSASDPNVRVLGFKLIATHAPTFSPMSVNGYDLNKLSDMDADIKEIIKIEATPMLYFYQIVNPIKNDDDAKRYGSSVQAVASHLRDTWPGQKFVFFFGNEPDWEIMRCVGQPSVPTEFWDGSRQDFFKAYDIWAKAIKSIDAGFIVGGAGVAIPVVPINIKDRDCEINVDFTGIPGEVNRWVSDFLDYAQSNKVPVDFFSFHAYSKLLRVRFYDEVGKLAAKLKEYPSLSPLFGAPLLATNEWNMMLTDDVGVKNLCFHGQWDDNCVKQLESFKTAYKSAHNIAALINMIDQGLQLNTAYAALYQNVPAKSTEETKSDIEGSCRFFTFVCANETRNVYHAFKGFNWLAETVRLAVSGADHANFSAIAGKGKTDKSIVIVLANYDYDSYRNNYPIANNMGAIEEAEYLEYKKNYGEPKVYNKYTLRLNNLPWSSTDKVVYERYIVDDNKKLELTETEAVPGGSSLTFSKDISAPSVEVVRVYVK